MHDSLMIVRERAARLHAERRERIAAMCLQGLLSRHGETNAAISLAQSAINYADDLMRRLKTP